MALFDGYPQYNPYRPLYKTKPKLVGEDVYALQIALNNFDASEELLDADGILGNDTAVAIWNYQRQKNLIVDGIAATETQKDLATRIARQAAQRYDDVMYRQLYGQIERESNFLLGNFSPIRSDGSYDAGVAQRNTNFHPPELAFDPVNSIDLLARNFKKYYDSYSNKSLYVPYEEVDANQRRIELAAGAWNAWAFTNYLAGVKPWAVPTLTARATLEEYMDSATLYVNN
jgi:hypothetical protein